MLYTSSCACSARFATSARSSLQSPCCHALKSTIDLNIMLWSSALHDCSHTADMHDVVMKCVKMRVSMTGYCNGNSGAHVQGDGQLDLTS